MPGQLHGGWLEVTMPHYHELGTLTSVELDLILCAGMICGTFCVLWIASDRWDDAERRGRHSDTAPRNNPVWRTG
jgi:hypothetical protein